jgi:hypothetical protein
VDTGFALLVVTGSAVAGMFPVATPGGTPEPDPTLGVAGRGGHRRGRARTGSALATTD